MYSPKQSIGSMIDKINGNTLIKERGLIAFLNAIELKIREIIDNITAGSHSKINPNANPNPVSKVLPSEKNLIIFHKNAIPM